MDDDLNVAEMTDEDLRGLCLAAVYLCISWIDQSGTRYGLKSQMKPIGAGGRKLLMRAAVH